MEGGHRSRHSLCDLLHQKEAPQQMRVQHTCPSALMVQRYPFSIVPTDLERHRDLQHPVLKPSEGWDMICQPSRGDEVHVVCPHAVR